MIQKNIENYWTDASNNYSNIINDELNSFRPNEWRNLILGEAPDKPVLDILDTGTGPGFFSIILSQAGHNVTGIDCAEGMIEQAKKNASQCGVSPEFRLMDCHELDFEDNSFDLIVSRNVTWTLRDPISMYAKWQKILRPEGKLLIFDANWHLHQYNEEIKKEVDWREKECIRIYGSTYSGDKPSSIEIDTAKLPLCKELRPDWDKKTLEELGFINVSIDRDITGPLWDDKEKLLFGATPMFMIGAMKGKAI